MRVFLCFTILLIASTAYSQKLISSSIPNSLKTRANAVIRDESLIVEMKSTNNVVVKRKKTITILNAQALEYGRIVEYYDKSTEIKSAKGEIFNDLGQSIGKFTLSNFADESAASNSSLYEAIRLKHFLPNVRTFPFTISYEMELKMKQNLLIRDWRPKYFHDVSIERANYQFISPEDAVINYNVKNFNGEHSIIKQGSMNIYSWTLTHIPATKQERLMPVQEHFTPIVQIAPRDFEYFNKKGSYSDWNELGTWVYNNLLKNKRSLPLQTKNEIDKLLKGVTDIRRKAELLYNYMQKRTRYVSIQIGIGGFEPFDAESVDQLRYGDCKALVNYMQSLLEYAGIPSLYCVVEAGYDKIDIDPTYASMAQGNHVILAIPIDGEIIWLECTDQNIPFGFLGVFTDDRNVLAISENGAEIIRTPKLGAEMNVQKRKGSFIISATGDVSGNLTTVFSGSQYFNHDVLRVRRSSSEEEKILKSLYEINNIHFSNIEYVQNKDINPQAIEKLSLCISGYLPLNNRILTLIPNVFNVQASPINYQERQFPIYIGRSYVDIDEITYELPPNRKFELPNPVDLNTEFGNYHFSLTQKKDQLILTRRLTIKEGTYPAEHYVAYYNFINTIRKSDLIKIFILPEI